MWWTAYSVSKMPTTHFKMRPLSALTKAATFSRRTRERQARHDHVYRALQQVAASVAVAPALLLAEQRERLTRKAGDDYFVIVVRDVAALADAAPQIDVPEVVAKESACRFVDLECNVGAEQA